MSAHEFIEQIDLPGSDAFHDFLVVQHRARRFLFDLIEVPVPSEDDCRWMFASSAAMMAASQSLILNGMSAVRIAEPELPTSATRKAGDVFARLAGNAPAVELLLP